MASSSFNPTQPLVSAASNPNHYSWGGLTPADSLDALRKWCHHNRPVLTWACHNAFELKRHPARGRSDVFLVMLDLTREGKQVLNTKPPKMFVVNDAYTIPKRVLHGMWPKIAEGIVKADEEHDKTGRKDRIKEEVTMILVQCGAHVNLIPCYWNRDDLAGLQEDRNWKTVLRDVTEGKRYLRPEGGR